ncbi:MAG: hypothetical protein SOV63_09235 [Pyramidobacter porci]|uniref:hypothetical protein n=1 Tax=Pyramidobacter porci TaxID=2605789 RepID=UPI002A747DD4|nr:hypothetical protein [Pyramidobacter porci]MDY2648974.1 hypothetical protein [Pyramidobacter porci]
MKKKRILNLAVCLFLALSVLCSVAYLFIEAVHDCHGHGCPVCAQMDECVKALAGFAVGAAAAYFYAERYGGTGRAPARKESLWRESATLVALKVKLSD